MSGPLEGVRILDFTRWQQGPYATVMLSDLGADVIKVEEPGVGDLGRALGRQPDGWCAYFEAHNRNKRSITLDVRKPEGLAVAHRLVRESDVVTDNFRPGVMKRLGMDYDTLVTINPRIITATASGFGPLGPDAEQPSFDSIGQARGGIMSNQGGGPDCPPQSVMSGLADQVGAMVFALGICAAIAGRERRGIGQHVDVSLLGSQIALQALQITAFLRSGTQPSTPQRWNPTFTHYCCADGKWLTLGILDPKWWEALCTTLGREDLVGDERFAEPMGRFVNRDALIAEFDRTFARRPRSEWLSLLREADVPAGPVNDYAGVAEDAQVLENGYIRELEHQAFGPVRVVGSPIRMSRDEVGPRSAAPEMGQHTEEILLSLGYDWEGIGALREAGAI